MGTVTLWQGDCLELMKNIPDGSVDLTVTSPPYDNLRTYNGNIDQWNFEKFKEIAKELYRVTANGGERLILTSLTDIGKILEQLSLSTMQI